MEAVGVVCGLNKKLGMAQVCAELYAAIGRGRILISENRDGWHDAEMPTRRMSWRGRYYELPRGCEDKTGAMYLIERCPFCSGDLPPIAKAPVPRCDGEGEE